MLFCANPRNLGLLASGFLVAALFLGGGTRAGFFGDVVLQVVAVALLLVAFWALANRREPPLGPQAKRQILVVLAVVPTICLLQLFPWTWLHDGSLGGSIPLSVSTNSTFLAALSALPGIAIFVSVVQLPQSERRRIIIAALVAGIVSVFVGLLQVAQGPQSALRFYTFTNVTEAVGFFANRNHFSALLYVLFMFATALAVHAAGIFGVTPWRHKFDRSVILPLVLSVVMVVVLLAAQSYARSRAGLGLTIVALIGGALLSVGASRQSMHGSRKVLFGAILLGVMIGAQFSLYRVLQRFDTDPLEDARLPFARNTFEAAKEYLPFGSGLGTFMPVYNAVLRPTDALLDKFANRAHNDFLEGLLETGIVGVLLAIAFLLWFVLRAAYVWKRSESDTLDSLICRAATISIVLLLAHSMVDYPLRTTGLLCIFALCCALLVEPFPNAWAEANRQSRQHKQRRPVSEPQVRRHFPNATSPVPRALADEWKAAESPSRDAGSLPRKAGTSLKVIEEWPSEWQPRRSPGRNTDK